MHEPLLVQDSLPAHATKHFNTAGPQIAALHYSIDPLVRINRPMIESLVAQQRYFVLHAPRQTGKTTCMLALRDYFNAGSDYCAIYANIENAQAMRGNVMESLRGIISRIVSQATLLFGNTVPKEALNAIKQNPDSDSLTEALRILSEALPRPLVFFLDEVDSLVGDTLISVLRQIRAGYTDRPAHFPHSIVLCGVRDVRDYRMTMGDGEVITGGSAFNIKAESLRLGDFSREELEALYAQHTAATGQVFTPEALELGWESTRGQPWLSNALAEQAVWKTAANLDRSVAIDETRMRAAREALILRNDSHLDQLSDKLKEPRVRAVIAPMLEGQETNASEADIQYLRDLGLIRQLESGLAPANSIYAEVLPRTLTSTAMIGVTGERINPSWKGADGKLNPLQFLTNFFRFWLEHGEPMMRTVPYHEVAPTLVLMAYLQRVMNGAGRIEREYAAGSGRLDLWVVQGDVRMAIEVKVWRDGRPDPQIEGLVQIERYLQRLNLFEGFLVIFDQRTTAPEWEKRMSTSKAATASGRKISVMRG